MPKMNDDDLLSLLRNKESEAATYVHGTLANDREKAMREYFREPYGNEEEGWSTIVSSDVQDTVEWILPALLEIFTASDQAVSFDPTGQEDVKAAQEATDGCNYVFFKQNNGFLNLYTAFKDALLVKNCAVMWRKITETTVRTQGYTALTEDAIAYILEQTKGEIAQAGEGYPGTGPDGVTPATVFDVRIKTTEERNVVKVEAFEPENLLIERTWTSPLLQDCPYVARLMPGTTLSELRALGFKVDDDEAEHDDQTQASPDAAYRANRGGGIEARDIDPDDASQGEVTLIMEYVLVDYDGDGIAERRCIYRLKDRILKNEECSHVPIATGSPIIVTHRWDGMSIAEAVSDLMMLKTELLRQMLNSLYLANNPRTKVLTDKEWGPLANLDDLLDSRPGGILRQQDVNAIQEHVTPWVGQQAFPMLEYVDGMRENRTGVTRYNQGIDANSLNKTATGISQIMSASQQRIKLIARILAETLVKPMFQGILKCLTDGGIDKLAFRLNNEFVQLDPNEWRDWYDMSINVGLGTGDKMQQGQQLQMIFAAQMQLLPMGLATPQEVYSTMAKITENAGFKNVGDFWKDPSKEQLTPPAQMLQQQMQQMQQMLGQLQQENQALKADKSIDQFNAETKRIQVVGTAQAPALPQGPQPMHEADKMMLDAQLKDELAQRQHERTKDGAMFNQAIAPQPQAQEVEPKDGDSEVMQGIQMIAQQMQALIAALTQPQGMQEQGGDVGQP